MKSKLRKKGKHLTKLLVVLVLILTIGVIYFSKIGKNTLPSLSQRTSSPTIDKAENWKTYTSVKYGYSIQYPPDWKITNGSTEEINPTWQPISSNYYLPSIGISIDEHNLGWYLPHTDDPTKSYIQTTFLGLPARQRTTSEEDELEFIKDNMHFQIGMTNVDPTNSPNKKLYTKLNQETKEVWPKMLASFKFTQTQNSPQQPNNTNQIINWQSFTNTKYGYQIKYPKGWYVSGSDTQDTLEQEVVVYITKEQPPSPRTYDWPKTGLLVRIYEEDGTPKTPAEVASRNANLFSQKDLTPLNINGIQAFVGNFRPQGVASTGPTYYMFINGWNTSIATWVTNNDDRDHINKIVSTLTPLK